MMLTDVGSLLTALCPESEPAPEIAAACRAIDADPLISLSRLADELGLPRGRFAARFQADTGFRPVEYRLLRRADAARTMLRQLSQPLCEVAFAAGFADQSHMTNALRRIFNLTPTRIRRAA
jgi:AraC-like DNA-binding protein